MAEDAAGDNRRFKKKSTRNSLTIGQKLCTKIM